MAASVRVTTWRLEAKLGSAFVNIMGDVLAEEGIRSFRGMKGSSPLDRVASPGTLEFSLRNGTSSSGRVRGYYTPGHANCRSGWAHGTRLRLIARYASTDYTLWQGRVRTARATPGIYGARRVAVLAQDFFGDLSETTLREFDAQINQTDITLLGEIAAALPTYAGMGGAALSWSGGGLDTFPYAFDDFKGGMTALAALNRIAMSTFGLIYPNGSWSFPDTPEFTYIGRNAIAAKASEGTITAAHIAEDGGLDVADRLDAAYNRVRVTTHPKTIDAVNTSVLYSAPNVIDIPPDDSIELWGDYVDADNKRLIGAYDFTAFTAGVDVIANVFADGSGPDYTFALNGAGTTPFASAVKFVIANATGHRLFLTTLQLRGRGIHDDGPVTSEAVSGNGERPIEIDMPYQGDPNNGQALADYVLAQYGSLDQIPQRVTINPHVSTTMMLQALQRDIADVITLSEEMTGLDEVECLIQGIGYEITAGGRFRCQWTLAPAGPSRVWVLDNAALSVLNSTTILGYA